MKPPTKRARRSLGSAAQALRSDPAAVAAYAERAAALRWDEAATRSVEKALDASWSDSLASLYGRLPSVVSKHVNPMRTLAAATPGEPGAAAGTGPPATCPASLAASEGYLHRAIAQAAGSEGWEAGHGFAEAGDETLARLSYANALRSARDEAIVELPGRDTGNDLRRGAIEERDEHGMTATSSVRSRPGAARDDACASCGSGSARSVATKRGGWLARCNATAEGPRRGSPAGSRYACKAVSLDSCRDGSGVRYG